MTKINVEGADIEIEGNTLTPEQFDFIYELKRDYESRKNPSGLSDEYINPETGYYNLPEVDNQIRFLVSAAPNYKSKVRTLKKFFKEVVPDEYDPNNFILTNDAGEKFILDDKSKTNLKDVIDEGKGITQAVTSTGAAILAAPSGPGAVVASGAGLALGSEAYERIAQLAGLEIDRDLSEYAKTRGLEFAIGATAELAGPLFLKGFKNLVRGTDQKVFQSVIDQGLAKNIKDAKKVYRSMDLNQKINSNIRLDMNDRLKLFNKYEVPPTIAQATDNKLFDTLETTFTNVPFASQIMRESAERSQNKLGETFVDRIANALGFAEKKLPKGFEAGEIVQLGFTKKAGDKLTLGQSKFGITGGNGAIARFRANNAANYGAVKTVVDQAIKEAPDKAGVKLTNTIKFLDEEFDKISAAFPKLSNELNDAKLQRLSKKLIDDLEGGTVASYKDINELKKFIGKKLSNPTLYDKLPRSDYKRFYGAITDDIKLWAENFGGKSGTDILNAIRKADQGYQAGIKVIDDFVEPIAKKANPDKIIASLFSSGKEGPTQIRQIMSQLTQDENKVLVGAMIERLGEAPAKAELGALGRSNYFSSKLFLDNYGKLNKEARDIMFGSKEFLGKEFATLNNSLKEVRALASYQEVANPFKDLTEAVTKGQAGTGLLVAAGAGLTAGTGDPLFLLGIPVFGYGGAYSLKLLSNPAFMQWVANGTKIAGNRGFDGLVKHIAKLGIIAGNSDNDISYLTDQYLEVIKNASDQATINEEQTRLREEEIQQQEAIRANQQQSAIPQQGIPQPSPVNTQVTNPMQYASLFPQDALGQAIAQRKVI